MISRLICGVLRRHEFHRPQWDAQRGAHVVCVKCGWKSHGVPLPKAPAVKTLAVTSTPVFDGVIVYGALTDEELELYGALLDEALFPYPSRPTRH